MVTCSYCSSRAVHYAHHFGKFLCRSHLETYLLRKLRRNLNKHRLVSPRDVVAVEDGSTVGKAARALFEKAVRNWPVKVVSPREKHTKLLVPHTLEFEASAIIDGLASGEIYRTGYRDGKTIKPFRDFSSKELFVLGWLMGYKEEGVKETHPRGVASKLNLLRSWDRILEVSRRPQNTANKSQGQKQGQSQKSRP